MKLAQRWIRWRNRSLWTDPVRRVRTLESFAATEDDGGKDLLAAAKRILDADLRRHIQRHAEDEVRHASLFRGRAAELRSEAGLGVRRDEESGRAFDLIESRRGAGHDRHSATMCDELGEVAYVAMLHVAEQRARDLFEVHQSLLEHDPETRAVFEQILRDENYHVAYTSKFLDDWQAQGRGAEVVSALSAAKSSRFLGAWKRLGLRSGAGFSQVLLLVMYWTVLLPFGVLSRCMRRPPAAAEVQSASKLGSQY
ncbi:MAG: hypothetical protein AAF628_02705 [Planctomycetota bacterium]